MFPLFRHQKQTQQTAKILKLLPSSFLSLALSHPLIHTLAYKSLNKLSHTRLFFLFSILISFLSDFAFFTTQYRYFPLSLHPSFFPNRRHQKLSFSKKTPFRLIIHSLVLLLFNTLAHTHTHTPNKTSSEKCWSLLLLLLLLLLHSSFFVLRSSFPHVLPFWSYSQHQWLLSTIFNTHSFTHTHTHIHTYLLTHINICIFMNLHTCILICFFLLIVHLLHFVHLFAMNFIQ